MAAAGDAKSVSLFDLWTKLEEEKQTAADAAQKKTVFFLQSSTVAMQGFDEIFRDLTLQINQMIAKKGLLGQLKAPDGETIDQCIALLQSAENTSKLAIDLLARIDTAITACPASPKKGFEEAEILKKQALKLRDPTCFNAHDKGRADHRKTVAIAARNYLYARNQISAATWWLSPNTSIFEKYTDFRNIEKIQHT